MRYGRLVVNTIGLVAALAIPLGVVVAHFGIAPPLAGFAIFALGGIVATITAVVGLGQRLRGRRLATGGVLAVAAAAGFIAAASQGRGHPRINDFTTDLAEPPAFGHATTLPPNAGRDMGYPPAFAAIQRECCADLHAATVKAAPAEAYAKALAVARARPTWTVTHEDAAGQTFEAVDTTKLFRFQDDIAVRVRPAADGTSRVDVRSKSRDGQGDLGVNAKRIRAFVADLEPAR